MKRGGFVISLGAIFAAASTGGLAVAATAPKVIDASFFNDSTMTSVETVFVRPGDTITYTLVANLMSMVVTFYPKTNLCIQGPKPGSTWGEYVKYLEREFDVEWRYTTKVIQPYVKTQMDLKNVS